MDSKETLSSIVRTKTLASDPYFFKYIFKKTEKIACAVLYVLRSNKDTDRSDPLVRDTEAAVTNLMHVSFESLESERETVAYGARKVGFRLVELESSLRILNAARIIPSEFLQVFVAEIDAVTRSLNSFVEQNSEAPLFVEEGSGPTGPQQRQLSERPTRDSARAGATAPVGGVSDTAGRVGRRERIIAILRDKGQASIKDVSDAFSDCSEKTIQRELNALIKDGAVVREGERRWSRYSLPQ